jgi:hypothetical protein
MIVVACFFKTMSPFSPRSPPLSLEYYQPTSMGGLAADPSLRTPWQRALQICTALCTVALVYTMFTVAPKYQQSHAKKNETAEAFRQVRHHIQLKHFYLQARPSCLDCLSRLEY